MYPHAGQSPRHTLSAAVAGNASAAPPACSSRAPPLSAMRASPCCPHTLLMQIPMPFRQPTNLQKEQRGCKGGCERGCVSPGGHLEGWLRRKLVRVVNKTEPRPSSGSLCLPLPRCSLTSPQTWASLLRLPRCALAQSPDETAGAVGALAGAARARRRHPERRSSTRRSGASWRAAAPASWPRLRPRRHSCATRCQPGPPRQGAGRGQGLAGLAQRQRWQPRPVKKREKAQHARAPRVMAPPEPARCRLPLSAADSGAPATKMQQARPHALPTAAMRQKETAMARGVGDGLRMGIPRTERRVSAARMRRLDTSTSNRGGARPRGARDRHPS